MTCLLLPTTSAITASGHQLFSWHPWIDGPGPERKTAALRWWPDPGHSQTHQTTASFSSSSEGLAHPHQRHHWPLCQQQQWSECSMLYKYQLPHKIKIFQKKTPKRLFVPRNMQSYFHEGKVNWASARAASQRSFNRLFLTFTSLKKCYFPATHTQTCLLIKPDIVVERISLSRPR